MTEKQEALSRKLAILLKPSCIACSADVGSKKRVLELLGTLISAEHPDLSATEVLETLIARERLGSTGLGHGVAIPHGRQKRIDQVLCAFVQLAQGIDFDAIDGQPVDLVLAMLVPEQSTDEHLLLLAMFAEMLRDEHLREQLRTARTNEEVYALLTKWRPASAQPNAAR